MEQYNLTAKEFIYLCLNAGARRVYGIEDEFKKVRKENLMTEFSKVQKELVQKRYMRMDFDGNVIIKKKMLEEIEICSLCDRVVLFKAARDMGNTKRNYYFKDDKVVSLVWTEGSYVLERVDKAEVMDIIRKEMLTTKEVASKEKVSLSVKQSEVPTVLKEKNIRRYGCYSLVQVKKDAEKRVENLLFLETNQGILSVNSKIVGLDNMMDIESCSVAEMQSSIQRLLK